MNKILKSLLFSVGVLLILSFLFSAIASLISLKGNVKIPEIIGMLVSFLIFFFVGIMFGYVNKKQGLSRGLLFCLVYILFVAIYYLFIFNGKTPGNVYLICSGRCILILLGSIIGVNKADKKAIKTN